MTMNLAVRTILANQSFLAQCPPQPPSKSQGERAVVAVFADHAPPPKLAGIVDVVDIDELGEIEYTE